MSALTELLAYDPTLLSLLDERGDAAIHIATWEGNWAALKLLLDHGEDIGRKSTNDNLTVFDIATSEYVQIALQTALIDLRRRQHTC